MLSPFEVKQHTLVLIINHCTTFLPFGQRPNNKIKKDISEGKKKVEPRNDEGGKIA